MNPIAIFYHCLFYMGDPPQALVAAPGIVQEQMVSALGSGLIDAASHILVGINGGEESRAVAETWLPSKSLKVFHGLSPKNENRTIVEIEKWLHLHSDWYVLYFHSKGATKPVGDWFTTTWRRCMMKWNILNWRQCVRDLESGYDAVGVHWMQPPATPEGQYIFAGTFWWATAEYLLTLPSIQDRDRIKVSGLDSAESRYETEVWIGNGPRVPHVKDYHCPPGGWNPSKIATCEHS